MVSYFFKGIFFLLFIGTNTVGVAADKVGIEISQVFREPVEVTRYNQNQGEAIKYKEKLRSVLEKLKFSNEKQEVMVLTHFYKGLKGEVTVHARPKLSEAAHEEILKKVKRIKIPLTRFTNQTMLTLIKVNEGLGKDTRRFYPELKFSNQLEFEKFDAMVLEKKIEYIKNWAANDAIPILSRIGANGEAKYGAVKQFSRLMGANSFKSTSNVKAISDSNFYYWRGMMELNEKDQLLPLGNVLMHAATGDFAHGNRYLPLILMFSSSNTTAHYFAKLLNKKLNSYYNHIQKEVQWAFDQNATGNKAEALKKMNSLKELMPNSPIVLYHKFELDFDPSDESEQSGEYWREWENVENIIHRVDPCFFTDINARSGMDGYRMFKRAELLKLFKAPENYERDLLIYADISIDLEDYALAGFLNWNIMKTFPLESYNEEQIIKDYIYCLLKLENEKVAKNFRKDLIGQARLIEEERFNRMTESDIFKVFEKMK